MPNKKNVYILQPIDGETFVHRQKIALWPNITANENAAWTNVENSLIEKELEQENYAKIFCKQWQQSWRWAHCLGIVATAVAFPLLLFAEMLMPLCRSKRSWWFVYRSDMPFAEPFFCSQFLLFFSLIRYWVFVNVRSRFMHCYAYYFWFLPRGKTRLHGWIIFLVPLNRIAQAESIISKWFSFLFHSSYISPSFGISLSSHHILSNSPCSSLFFFLLRISLICTLRTL